MTHRAYLAACLCLLCVLAMAGSASAHAFLERADPRVGSTVRAAPAQVRLWFTESLEPAFSTLRVVSRAGDQVDKNDAQVDPAAPKLLRVSLPPLPAGTYKVIWRVLSLDTHVTEGTFSFTVAP